MKVTVNGEERLAPYGWSVAKLVADIGAPQQGTAVAVNGDVVVRREWPHRLLHDGDRVEVLTAVQGG
jgi:sulfur carrier protein